MLDSEVHHLEVRTGTFDKLIVLASGSLALGITFLGTGYQSDFLREAIRPHINWLTWAMILILLSLVTCVIHNLLISKAVTLLSKQVEHTYKAAHEMTAFFSSQYSPEVTLPKTVRDQITSSEKQAEVYGSQKESAVTLSTRAGSLAAFFLIAGYAVGLYAMVLVFASNPHSPQASESHPRTGTLHLRP
jgi:hypothetical protein